MIGKLVRAIVKKGVVPRIVLGATAGMLVAILPAETQNAVANGDTRTIQLFHAHTHESITATYLVDGTYDQSVLDKLNWFLRDWRRDEPTKMDPKLFDTIWEVYRESGSHQPIEVMSAYRSPETNAMLRRRSRAVAEHSQHILGKAMDQHYMDVPMSRIREIAMRLQRGGVGFYPTAGTPFVHMDVGGVRHWPRMSYDQLARLFPDGKTVHIPSNGQPLPGYELARAELESRGDQSYPTASQLKTKGFFAWLFGGSDEDEDVAAEGGGRSPRAAPNTRTAMADRGSGRPGVPTYDSSSKDGGMYSFMASQSPQPAPTTPYGRVAHDAPAMASAAAPQPAPAAPAAPAPSPEAEQTLAVAMNTAETSGASPTAPPLRSVPDLPAAPQAMTSNGLVAPMPPRRPTELAQAIDLPLPPTRPAELARPVEGPAPTPARLARADAIGALLGGRPGAATPGVLRGGPGAAGAQVLAYADTGTSLRAVAGGVPLPVPRPPDLVGARLDRGNFHVLTSATNTDRSPTASSLGAALGARAAARAAGSAYAPPSPVLSSFGSRSSDLAADRFSGPSIRGQERLVPSRRADAGLARSTTE